MDTSSNLAKILNSAIGFQRAEHLLQVLSLHPDIAAEEDTRVSRATISQALNMLLFETLLERVPSAKLYVERCLCEGKKILHDHGAVRTVALAGMGSLPAGQLAITRILEPLGYELNGLYPLERLCMTGRSYAHKDYPEAVAQFFISELHPERFSPAFQNAVLSVTRDSTDPLVSEAKELLAEIMEAHSSTLEQAIRLLPMITVCFDRQHPDATLTDYEALLAESPEMAWIGTEGNAFNHATDRVADVDRLAVEQKALGQPMKASVETSQSGRIRQTALLAARVRRRFRLADESFTEMEVPGSFYEFITRLPLPDQQKLDLGFDSSNAQAIFKMTANRGS